MSTDSRTDAVDVVIVGSIGIDDIETPTETRKDLLGGSVSYACAAASFFSSVGMVGVVGDDFESAHVDAYTSFGIDLEGLQHVEGKTFRWSGVYHEDMINRDTISTDLNVFADFAPSLPEGYQAAPYILLGNIQPELQLHVLEQCREPQFVIADTMDLWINIARESLMDVISRVHMLTLNDSEARLLTGQHNMRAAAAEILQAGPEYVVIKKGEHGAMLITKSGELFLVPAYPVDRVVDPTGAGDTFAGAFLGALARSGKVNGDNIRTSLLAGSVVASFGVEAFSLERLSTLTPEQVDKRTQQLCNMIRV
jgi:sugar/nucleoside kinase (ribokinase family)